MQIKLFDKMSSIYQQFQVSSFRKTNDQVITIHWKGFMVFLTLKQTLVRLQHGLHCSSAFNSTLLDSVKQPQWLNEYKSYTGKNVKVDMICFKNTTEQWPKENNRKPQSRQITTRPTSEPGR
jgi:hypothetical protein